MSNPELPGLARGRRSSHDRPSLGNGRLGSRSRSRSNSFAFLGLLNPRPKHHRDNHHNLLSLYRMMIVELNLPTAESSKQPKPNQTEDQEQAFERLVNMGQVPMYLEKFMVFGLLVCLNSFLTLFTLVPLKICIVFWTILRDMWLLNWDTKILIHRTRFVKRDLITMFLIIATLAILCSPILDVSRLYHDVRGQAHIKLYVMFGVLEVTDKLLSSLGQEILAVLYGAVFYDWSPRNLIKISVFLLAALLYSACHAYTLVYQSVSLHVAANSYSNALLTLLLSNQFAELKSAVFKKFEREGLFQVTLSDLTERFQLSVILFTIALRNLSQLSSTELGLIPDSWKSWNKWFGAIFGPSVVVLGSEIFVDWVKHCYVNKFNCIRPRVYDNFLYVLSLDYMEIISSTSKSQTSHEVSDYIFLTRRIGLPIMSIAVCVLRMTILDLKAWFWPSTFSVQSILLSLVLVLLTFMALLATRLILGLAVLQWARSIKTQHEQYQQSLKIRSPTIETHETEPVSPLQELSEPGSPDQPSPSKAYYLSESEIDNLFLPGVPNTEASSVNPSTRKYLYDQGENVPPTPEEKRNGELRKRTASAHGEKPWIDNLQLVHRYKMSSKRIW